jgi:hypothetical protein
VIFDRYIYDELANLSLSNPILRIYARLILKLTPKPDVSYILDADPAQARARKPEYPLDFLVQNRNAYLRLSKIAGGLTVVPPLAIDKVKDVVVECASRLFGVAAARNFRRPRLNPCAWSPCETRLGKILHPTKQALHVN